MLDLLFFGQLTDITGASSMQWQDVPNTEVLLQEVQEKYPQLAHMKYVVAVNNKMITEPMVIASGSKIAFMPPFSGG